MPPCWASKWNWSEINQICFEFGLRRGAICLGGGITRLGM